MDSHKIRTPSAIVVDNLAGTFTGTWAVSTSVGGYYGANYQAQAPGAGANSFTWTPTIPSTGTYKVYARWTIHPNRSTHAVYTVNHAGGATAVTVNQEANGGSGLVTTLGSGSTAEAASGNVTPGLPADWLVNDFLLTVIESRDNVAATMPAGWTLLNEGSGAGGTHRASLFWKFAAPGETAPVVTHPGGNRIVARIVAFRGVDIANPFDTPHSFTASAADTTTEAGGLTTVTSGVTLVLTAHIGAQSTTFTPPSGWSLAGSASSGGSSDGVSIAIYRRPNQNPGVKAALTLTHSDSAESHGAQIALRPLRTVVIAKPAGTVLNDTMIATLVLSGQNPTSTPPAGWTLLRRLQGISSAMEVYLKVAGSAEPAEYPWTLSPGVVTGPLAASLQAYAGVDPANPIDVEAGQNTASGLTHATPGVTTTTPNTMLVTAHAYKASGTWTPPSGMTEVIDVATHGAPNSNGVSLENNYALQSSAGAVAAKIATASNNGNTGHTHVLALRPGTSTPRIYFVHTDHLNTPRLITSDTGQAVWSWANDDPYGNNAPNENPSGAGNFTCNLRLPGQYFDAELNTHYNYFRDYDPATGRYIESDPIGLRGGNNTYAYAKSNPLSLIDPFGLFVGKWHLILTSEGITNAGMDTWVAEEVAKQSVLADWLPRGSQDTSNAHWHAMRDPTMSPQQAQDRYEQFLEEQIQRCSLRGLGRAIHAAQDSAARGHQGNQPWNGAPPSWAHFKGDIDPTDTELALARQKTRQIIERYQRACGCAY